MRTSSMKGKALAFFKKNTLHFEVQLQNGGLEKVYFPCPPQCKHLDKETKIQFNREANRLSAKSKVTSLQKAADGLIKVMKHNYFLR